MKNYPARILSGFSTTYFGPRPVRALVRIFLLLAVVFALTQYCLTPTLVVGSSMEPTLDEGDCVLVNRLAFRLRKPARGEIVCVRGNGEWLMKRVVALPGEVVAMTNGLFFIDGTRLVEPYVRHPSKWTYHPARLRPDQCLVIGDNRGIEQVMGTISVRRLAGCAIGYPPDCYTIENRAPAQRRPPSNSRAAHL